MRCLKAALHQLTAFHSSGASATGRAGLNMFHVEQLLLKLPQMRWHKKALATVYRLLQAGFETATDAHSCTREGKGSSQTLSREQSPSLNRMCGWAAHHAVHRVLWCLTQAQSFAIH